MNRNVVCDGHIDHKSRVVIVRPRSHGANAKATSLRWVLSISIVPFTLSESEAKAKETSLMNGFMTHSSD